MDGIWRSVLTSKPRQSQRRQPPPLRRTSPAHNRHVRRHPPALGVDDDDDDDCSRAKCTRWILDSGCCTTCCVMEALAPASSRKTGSRE